MKILVKFRTVIYEKATEHFIFHNRSFATGDSRMPMPLQQNSLRDAMELALLLRDFFYCKDALSLRQCWNAFPDCEELSALELQKLEYEFNRLFVGPNAPFAPPYASVYLENEPRLMGACTLEVRRLYQALGLATPESLPDDFLPFELEAWIILADLAEGDRDARRAFHWLTAHLLSWLEHFTRRLEQASLSPPMLKIMQALNCWQKLAKGVQI